MILAQLAPTANTDTKFYQLQSGPTKPLGLFTICNQTAIDQTFSVAFVPNSASISSKHYMYYQVTIQAKGTFIVLEGATVKPTLALLDAIWVRASDAGVTFTLFD